MTATNTPRRERQHFSTSDVVREAMRAFGMRLMQGILPSAAVSATPQDAGASENLPQMIVEWASVEAWDTRPEDEEVLPDGRGVWRLHREEAGGAFKFLGRTPEEADYCAREFVRRAKREARKSNPEGNPVLHFVVDAGGARRTGKLYLPGHVVPLRTDDEVLRSLYAFRVPVTADYPVMDVEDEKSVGLLNIVIEVGENRIDLKAMYAAIAAAEES